MRSGLIPLIAKRWLAVALVLVLFPWVAVAGAAASLDEQLIEAAKRGDLALVKTLLDRGGDGQFRFQIQGG